MKAIFKREFLSYFHTVLGFIFIAAILFFFGLYSYAYNMAGAYSEVTYPLQAITFLFMIIVPLLTMKSMAEDRKTKTDQLILTAPVSVGKIVLAKFMAVGAIFSIAAGIMCIYPIWLSRYGTIAYGETYTGMLGLWLYGLLCISIGIFVSSITESMVLAAVISFVALFVGFMMSSISELISASGALEKVLNCLDITAGMDSCMEGTLDISGIVYYVTATALFLFLACQAVQKRRWSGAKSKKAKLSVFSSGLIVAGIVVCVLINVVVAQLPEEVKAIDVTQEKLYTLTDETKEYQNLDKDVTIYVLEKEADADDTLSKTLDRYEDLSKHITVTYVDPSVSPNFYTNYTDSAPTENSLIVECGDVNTVISYDSIYETEANYNTYAYETTGYDGEGQITSAINYVTSEEQPVVYTLSGHGESSLGDSFEDALKKMNISVESFSLLETEAVPEDAEFVIINGATSDINEDEAQILCDYIKGGGRMLITLTYTQEDMSNLKAVLNEINISMEDGIVVEQDTSNYYKTPYYLLPVIVSTDLTTDISNDYVFMPYSVGLDMDMDSLSDTENIVEFFSSSEDAISKTDAANATSYEKEKGDIDGPFALGLWYTNTEETEDEDEEAQILSEVIVLSSATTFTDEADNVVSGTNLSFFKTAVTELLGDDEDSSSTISIDVKSYESESLTVSEGAAEVYRVMMVWVLPVALIAAGIIIWVKRRRG